MHTAVKKIEIITDYVFVNKFTAKLDENNVKGYSIIKDVLGKGSSGNKDGHGMMAGFKNCYIMLICQNNDFDNLITIISDLTKRYGGITVVTEAILIKESF